MSKKSEMIRAQPPGVDARQRAGAEPISRREILRRGLWGSAGVLLGAAAIPRAFASASGPRSRARAQAAALPLGGARSVIQIWMWGGPSHLDTFDPKPNAGYDYTGPLNKPIATNVDGIVIGELLPLLAKQADKYAIIRSMTHGINAHETAAYMVQTGRKPGDRLVFPGVGAVVSLFKGRDAGYKDLIPPYVVMTQPQGRFDEAGFLGIKYRPFVTGGDPNQAKFAVEGIVAPGVTEKRQRDRRELLHALDTLGQFLKGDAALEAFARTEDEAYDLILGDAGKVFDLDQEKPEVRDSYGRNAFGQAALAARRLVERGVPYVTINYEGWDTHRQHFQAMRQKLPQLDKGMAALLQDLSQRGLLGTTIVWWSGEFGRTPRVQWEPPWNGGRGHYGQVFSAVLAGGGFKGGRVVGASDERGEQVKDRPVYPADLIGSIYQLLGIDPDGKLPNPGGLDVRVTPTAAEGVPMAGRLKEIM